MLLYSLSAMGRRAKGYSQATLLIALLVLFVQYFGQNLPIDPRIKLPQIPLLPTGTISPQPTGVLGQQSSIATNSAIVTKVVDGDTVRVSSNNKEETIRMIGINTPETVDPRREVECFGKEASNRTKELLTGKQVVLESDDTQDSRDRYGRQLVYVWLDGVNINKQLIAEGYAYEYTYEQPYKYQFEFKEAQLLAQETKKGLWADNTCRGNK
jgi:micrococcal nuclease